MSAETQAKIERLKQLLGDDYPEPLAPLDTHATNQAKTTSQVPSTGVSEGDKIPSFSDSEGESDEVVPTMPSTSKGKQNSARRNKFNGSSHQQTLPWRAKPHLQLFNPHHKDIGRLAPVNQAFCPVIAVSKYPYKFVSQDISEPIAERFFNDSKFWYRPWDVYYVWPQVQLTAKPILLIPTEQVEQLLLEIYVAFNKEEKYYLTLGEEAKDFGLVLESPDHPDIRPRYLGHSKTREVFAAMEHHVPSALFRPPGEAKPSVSVDSVTLAAWMATMEAAFEVSKGRSKASKLKKKDQQLQKKRHWKGQLRQAERLLGFRPGAFKVSEPSPDATWEEVQAYHTTIADHRDLNPINPHEPPPYDFELLPIFLSIDVECFEHDKSKVTEVGIAMLDMKDVIGLAPGEHGKLWHDKIKARHIRIREHSHLLNGNYVSDAADKFQFPQGGSEFVNLADARIAIMSCFIPPYCDVQRPWLPQSPEIGDDSTEPNEDSEDGGVTLVASEESHETESSTSASASTSSQEGQGDPVHEDETSCEVQTSMENNGHTDASEPHATVQLPAEEKRNIVIVGHDIEQDIRYLRRLDFDLEKFETATTLDTACLYRAHAQEWNPKSLGGLLYDYQLVGWHPHNAGNDAVHTLWAMIALVLEHTTQRGDKTVAQHHEERNKQRVEEAVVQAGMQAREQGEGWDSEDDAEEDVEAAVSEDTKEKRNHFW